MSSQAHETDIDGGGSRKRPHEMVNENGALTGDAAPPAREPRLMGDGHLLTGQILYNMNAPQIQGNAPFGQAFTQAQVNIQNNGAHGQAAPAPQAPAPQISVPTNIMMQNQALNGNNIAAAQQQAHAMELVRQLANAQANAQSIQATQGSAPAPFALPNAPQQINQAACFPVNHMMYTNQAPLAASFAPQQQPMAQPQQLIAPNAQSGQLRHFGMKPEELLNYAVMVNILHNSTAQGGNNNALSNILLNQPPPSQISQAVNSLQPAQPGVIQGMQGYAGFTNNSGVAPPPLLNPMQSAAPMMAAFATNQTGDVGRDARCSSLSYEHTVSPSLPSESNFQVTIPSHVIEAQKIDPQIRCVPLWTHQDQSRLSTQQCWLRKQIETFPASQRDVRRHTRGRNRILQLGQIGIQCIHCRNLPQEGRGKGSSYFLSSTKGIYQAAQNILAYHFKEDTCPIISKKLLQEMKDAGSAGCPRHLAPKAGKSRSGGGKSFWEDVAVRITGLVDTTVGIRYADDRQNYRPLDSVTLGLTDNLFNGINYCASESVLVSLEDKSSVTDFCFILLSQFVPYADESRKSTSELNSDSDLDDGDEACRCGIVCRFCKGVSFEGKHREGVFLSIKPSTMMRNKQMNKLHNHLLTCRYVPEELKKTIVTAKEMHLPQSDQLKRGWKKVFFENVSSRLKSALDAAGDSSGGEMSSVSGPNEMPRL